MKKILLIGPFSPPITGNSIANDTLYNGLKKRNIQVDKINFTFPTLKENIGKLTLNKVIHYFLVYRYIYKLFSSNKVYITLGQTFFGVLKYAPFIYTAKILNKEIIVHIHGNHLRKEYENLKGFKKSIFYEIISQIDKGIVLSDNLKKNLSPFIESKNIFAVYNFVEENILDNVIADDIINKDLIKLKILFLSNLMKEKGVFDFLNSLKLLKTNCIPFEAKVAGAIDPIFEYELNSLFQELKEEVEYLGVVQGDQKLDLLMKSNVFVLPTYYSMEGQPISILEAMATGNIILTTDHAGIPDIFENNQNGFYIEKCNPKSIADKLKFIGDNLESLSSITINNYKEASSKYPSDKFVNEILNVIAK